MIGNELSNTDVQQVYWYAKVSSYQQGLRLHGNFERSKGGDAGCQLEDLQRTWSKIRDMSSCWAQSSWISRDLLDCLT